MGSSEKSNMNLKGFNSFLMGADEAPWTVEEDIWDVGTSLPNAFIQ